MRIRRIATAAAAVAVAVAITATLAGTRRSVPQHRADLASAPVVISSSWASPLAIFGAAAPAITPGWQLRKAVDSRFAHRIDLHQRMVLLPMMQLWNLTGNRGPRPYLVPDSACADVCPTQVSGLYAVTTRPGVDSGRMVGAALRDLASEQLLTSADEAWLARHEIARDRLDDALLQLATVNGSAPTSAVGKAIYHALEEGKPLRAAEPAIKKARKVLRAGMVVIRRELDRLGLRSTTLEVDWGHRVCGPVAGACAKIGRPHIFFETSMVGASRKFLLYLADHEAVHTMTDGAEVDYLRDHLQPWANVTPGRMQLAGEPYWDRGVEGVADAGAALLGHPGGDEDAYIDGGRPTQTELRLAREVIDDLPLG